LTVAGAILLFGFNPGGERAETRLWPVAPVVGWLLAGLGLFGLVFPWWGRIPPGQLLAGSGAPKEDPPVVRTRPYAIVRHPIYTGILLAISATVLAQGTIITLVGSALIGVGIYVKARVEEDFLRQQLGESYDAYARRVPMLLPFRRVNR